LFRSTPLRGNARELRQDLLRERNPLQAHRPDGSITEAGFFEPLGGATSAPHWAPDGRTVYAIDYQRGIDVIRWNGPLYVPKK
jgi:hypothetical protein